ncbi:uncharacterized protein [Aegilops tauschii subsp. strangulata]|uniref:uncharacterized protein n=1 Tax=Aegilops tauschii subsp. strangulata TaxID=200361 RepID=UPI003CC8D933
MARHVFNRIREEVVAHDPYFECKTDALGKLGFSSYQKCTAAIRMLAYGIPSDLVDEYRSPVFARLAEGHSPPVNFEINGHQYNKGYYLADGIYPQWSTFVKTISKPQGEKRKRFAQMQESARKDVERAFGVLQSRWGIVRNPALSWDERKLWEVITACVIMHNMIVEDERDASIFDQGFDYQGENIEPLHQDPATFEQFVQFHREMRDWHSHLNLQNDLVEHVWDYIGNQ